MNHEPIIDPFKHLEDDHRKVKGWLEEACETTDRAEKSRAELFEKINDALTVHAELEEACLYPTLEEIKKTHGLTMESFEEHHVVKILLKELEMLPTTDETWLPKLTVLKENLYHHIKEEEGELFPKSRSALSEEQIAAIAAAMNEFLDLRVV